MGPQPPEFDKGHPMEPKILRMRVMGAKPTRKKSEFHKNILKPTGRHYIQAERISQTASSQPAIHPPASQPAAKPASQAASSQPEASHPTSRQPELMLPKLDTLT